jgi:hypothetical protein
VPRDRRIPRPRSPHFPVGRIHRGCVNSDKYLTFAGLKHRYGLQLEHLRATVPGLDDGLLFFWRGSHRDTEKCPEHRGEQRPADLTTILKMSRNSPMLAERETQHSHERRPIARQFRVCLHYGDDRVSGEESRYC